MTKKITFLITAALMLLTMIVSPGRAVGQTRSTTYEAATSIAVNDVVLLVAESSTYKKELSGFTTSGTIYGTVTDYTSIPTGVYPLTVVAGNSEGSFAFKNSEDKYLSWSSGNTLQLSNEINNNSSWTYNYAYTVTTLSNVATTNRQIKYNSSSPRFACYTSGQQSIKLYKQVSSSLQDNDLSLDGDPVALDFDLYTNNSAQVINYTTSSTGEVTIADNQYIETVIDKDNKTITVTPVKVTPSTQTITVNQAADATYAAGSTTFTISIANSAPYTQPTEIEANLNNSLFGTNYSGSASNITDNNPLIGIVDNVTVTYAGSGNHYVNNSQIRFYPNNKLTFEAPSGYEIKQIVFTSAGTWAATISADGGTYNSSTKTWTGSASSVLFTGSGSSRCDMSKADITIGAASSLPTPTITIVATGITNTNVFEGTDAGSLSASVTYNEVAVEGATVTWSGNNDEVATINTTSGAVTLVAAGSVTFTATFAGNENYNSATAPYVMTVTNDDPNAPGTENNPYTVADAMAAIDAQGTINEAYVTGIVSQVDSYNSSYHSITYWISDDGETTTQLEVYSGKGLNGANFSSVADVQVGATVVVKGKLKLYNQTYEFDYNNELVSYTAPQVTVEAPTFSPAAGTYDEAQSVTLSCATDGAAIHYTTDGTEPDGNSTQYSEPISVSTTTTFKAKAIKGSNMSSVVTATYHINSASSPYTVAQALAFHEYPTSTIWVHGIVSTAPTQAPTNSGQLTYYISDDGTAGENNQLEVYKGLGLNGAAFTAQDDIQVGDIVTITGIVKIYSSTIEFDTNNQLTYFERPTPTVPTITVDPATVNAPYAGADGTLTVTYENITEIIADVWFCNAAGTETATYNWITAEINNDNNVYYIIDANDGEARTAYLKVYALDDNAENVYSNLVTINQDEYVAPTYATLPFSFNGGRADIEDTYGLYQEGLGTDYSSAPKLKFDHTGDWVLLQFNEKPGTLTFDIKNNSFSGGTFTVQTSVDGVAYTDLENYTTITGTQNESFDNLSEDVRYIKWIYTEKVNGNVGLGNITLAKHVAPQPSITVNPATVNATAAETDGTIDVTLTAIANNDIEVVWFESDGNTAATYNHDWIQTEITTEKDVYYLIGQNTGDARSAYFKVYGLDGEANDIYSELITISQAAPVTPPATDNYELYSGTLVEGDYIIYYDGYAMKNTVSNNRLSYETVTPANDIIATDDATIVWHIAPSDDYWTIYSADANKYAASTNSKNQATLISDVTDNAKWTVTGTETYEFENLARSTGSDPNNKWLRNNGTNGFACYSTSTGGALSLYKKVDHTPSITINPGPYNMNCDGGHAVLDVAYANMAQNPQLEVIFYESDGTTAATYNHDWIDAHIDNDGNLDGTIQLNTSNEIRSAYFKIKGVGNNSELVYSDLVTINQAAYALSIVFETTELNIEVGGEQNRVLSFEYQGFGQNPAFEVRQYDATGQTQTTYEWLTTTITQGHKVNITVAANTGSARSGYFKVYGTDGTVNTESNLVTINQAEYIAPTYTVTYNANGGTGTMTDPNSPYVAGVEVTLLANTFIAPEGKIWNSWEVKDADNQDVTVNEGKFTMPASNVTVTAQWIDNPIVPTYEWVLTALEDLTSSDVFVIVGNNGSNYAMTNNNGTTSAPSATTVNIANNKLSNDPAEILKWNIEISNNGYTFYPNGVTNKWLYCTDANNGLRVGTGDNKVFAYEEVTITDKEGFYLTITPASDKRYVCIYNNADWRSYKSGSIVKTDTKFFKRQVASTDPSITANDVNITSDATAGEITFTLQNPVLGGELTAAITAGNVGNWLTLGTPGETTLPFTCPANTEATARTATVTLIYTYNTKVTITATAVVTQAALIVDYATMPFAFDGGRDNIENTNGLTQKGLDTDYNASPKLKFKTAGTYVILKLNEAPVSLSYDIKSNGSGSDPWAGTFKVQTSADGETYVDLVVYENNLGDKQSVTHIDLASTVRYIKWIYTTKTSGNVALGNIHASTDYDIYGDMTINSNALAAHPVIVHNGSVVTYVGTNTNAADLIIEDGAQLIHTNELAATLQKNITAASSWKDDVDGWYFIASPVDNLSTSAVTGSGFGTYDLFAYDEPNAYWRSNTGTGAPFTELERGKGYLYANKDDVTLNFAGMMVSTNESISLPLSYACTYADVKGYNLMGNPFSCNLTAGDMVIKREGDDDISVASCLVINGGSDYETCNLEDGDVIKPGQGFFIQATKADQAFIFNRTSSSKDDLVEKGFIRIAAGNDNYMDKAYVHIKNGNTLRKMNIANSTIVYVMNDGDDYAAARVEELAGTMPIHFKAVADGEYTITINAKNIEASTLILFDDFTGEQIDLLETPTYAFKASAEDDDNRFKLIFDFNNNYNGVDDNYVNGNFAYQNGDELFVSGDGTLQVFDVMGRFVMSKEIHGNESISVSAFETGVYMLRFVGENIMTQKIIVR